MNLVVRTPPRDAYTTIVGRPITGIVCHNTVGRDGIKPVRGASWHYLIERSGRVYADVPEAVCAHHVASTDEWRPPWLLFSPFTLVSDANYQTIGIELVSLNGHPTLSWDGYTDAQYAAFRELAADLKQRHGLPFVGHGQLQLDRTDPVGFDWQRGGLGPLTGSGRYFVGDDMATIAELEAQIAALNGVNTQLALERDTKDQLLQEANSYIGALKVHELEPLRAEVESLKAQLASATQPIATRITRVHVTATLEGGQTQEWEGVPV